MPRRKISNGADPARKSTEESCPGRPASRKQLRFIAKSSKPALRALAGLLTAIGSTLPCPANSGPVEPAAADLPAAAETVRIGVLAFMGPEAAAVEWAPLARHLARELPRYRFEFEYDDLEVLGQKVADRAVDFVLTNPGHYVTLEIAHGVNRIATLEQGRNVATALSTAATVVAARDRMDLQDLSDIRGKVLAATSPDGFGGYQVVWRELAALRIDPERDLAQRLFVGFPMQRVLEQIDARKADVGIIRACLLEDLPDWRLHYRVLSARFEPAPGCIVSTRLYPNWPMAGLRGTPPELARELAIALLRMEPQAHGMAWTVPADYQSVHEVFRELRIGPYAYLRQTSMSAIVRQYWPFGLFALLALLGWGIYTLRAQFLVRTRTAALQRALDERRAFEARMRMNQEQADHLARLSVLGELSSTLAHELSQPLAGVANYAQSLLRRLDNARLTDDAVREAATSIAAQADAAAGILKRIKGFVRKRPTAREWHTLPALVAESVALFDGMQAQAPAIDVVDRLPAGLRFKLDPLQIQQILLNFFKNAQDAMLDLPAAQQRVEIRLEAEPGWAWIHVRDHGVGMDDEALGHLFEPFYTTKEDGLGIGLSICKSIAEAHGGRLQGARAADGPGMVFSLSLPIDEHATGPVDLPRR